MASFASSSPLIAFTDQRGFFKSSNSAGSLSERPFQYQGHQGLYPILNFRRLIEQNELAPMILDQVNAHLARKGLMLKRGSIVDATILAAPSSTKNAQGKRDPEMHQTKKGNQWYFGMKAHIGVDTDSGLVHTVVTRAANEADVTVVGDLLHGKESQVHADAGYSWGGSARDDDSYLETD